MKSASPLRPADLNAIEPAIEPIASHRNVSDGSCAVLFSIARAIGPSRCCAGSFNDERMFMACLLCVVLRLLGGAERNPREQCLHAEQALRELGRRAWPSTKRQNEAFVGVERLEPGLRVQR